MKHMENLVWQIHIAQEHSETGPDRPSYPSDILAGFSVYTELVEALTFPPHTHHVTPELLSPCYDATELGMVDLCEQLRPGLALF